MRKIGQWLSIIAVLLVVLVCVLIAGTLLSVEKLQPVQSEVLSSDSEYVATAYVSYLVSGLSQSQKLNTYSWGMVVLNPDTACFVYGGAVSYPELKVKEGFVWKSRKLPNGNTQFCARPD